MTKNLKNNKPFTLFRGSDSWVSYWLPIFTVLTYILIFTVIVPYLKNDFNWYLTVVSIVFMIGLPALTIVWFRKRLKLIKSKK